MLTIECTREQFNSLTNCTDNMAIAVFEYVYWGQMNGIATRFTKYGKL